MVEVNSPDEDAWRTAESDQVSWYWNRYGLVLVTNTRDFLLLGGDASGNPAKLETFSLVDSYEFVLTTPPISLTTLHTHVARHQSLVRHSRESGNPEPCAHIWRHQSELVSEAEFESDLQQPCVFGFEIMPAPFVVAHLQVGDVDARQPGQNVSPVSQEDVNEVGHCALIHRQSTYRARAYIVRKV